MADEFTEDNMENIDPDVEVGIEDSKDGADDKVGTLSQFVSSKFTRAETARFNDEQRWLKAYRNYRGVYGPDTTFTESEKSRIFVKVTKTKVLASYGQIVDVLFGNDNFPISVTPTTIPEGISEAVHFDMQEVPNEPAGMPKLEPGDTMHTIKARMGALENKLKPLGDRVKDGPGTTPTQITYHPAAVAGAKMQKKIYDQLEESNANKKLRYAAFECSLFGTGIMKGPFVTNKEYPAWEEKGVYKPVIKKVPSISSVSVWNFYPDPDSNNMEEADFVCERHKLTKYQLRALKKRPFFRSNSIDRAVEMGATYVEKWWESQLDEAENNSHIERFEAIEFWGMIDRETLELNGVDIPKEFKNIDDISVNIWVCNGEVIRVVMNPYKPVYLPYHAVPYEVNPYSFFGIGTGDNMEDTQVMMNGFMRMAIDNAALSGNLLIEIDEDNLSPGQDMTVFPGKVFRRQGGAPGQAIFGTKFPNVSNENM